MGRTPNTKKGVLPRPDDSRWCGSYCGECYECIRLDKWLKYTTRGARDDKWIEPVEYWQRHSMTVDSIEWVKRKLGV